MESANVQNGADESSSDQSSIDESSKYEVSKSYGDNVRCRTVQAEPAKTRVQNTSEYEELRAHLRERLESIIRSIYHASWDCARDASLKAAADEITQPQAQQRKLIMSSAHASSRDSITGAATRASSKTKPSASQHKTEPDDVNHSTLSSPQIDLTMVHQATRAACFAAARHAVRQLALDTVVSPLGIKKAAKTSFEKYLRKHCLSTFTDTALKDTETLTDRVGKQSERAFSEHFRRVAANYDTNIVITLDIVTRSTATGICVGARDAMEAATVAIDRKLRRSPTNLRMRGNEKKQDSKEAREQTLPTVHFNCDDAIRKLKQALLLALYDLPFRKLLESIGVDRKLSFWERLSYSLNVTRTVLQDQLIHVPGLFVPRTPKPSNGRLHLPVPHNKPSRITTKGVKDVKGKDTTDVIAEEGVENAEGAKKVKNVDGRPPFINSWCFYHRLILLAFSGFFGILYGSLHITKWWHVVSVPWQFCRLDF